MTESAPSSLARALGRLPTGLYLVACQDQGRPVGFVGSFVMQVGFDPPMVCVAVGKGRAALAALRGQGSFGLSILDRSTERIMGRFFHRMDPGQSPFDGLALERGPSGSPLLAGALAWLDCRIVGEHETGDHVVLFGEVLAGSLSRAGDPSVRLRADGLDY